MQGGGATDGSNEQITRVNALSLDRLSALLIFTGVADLETWFDSTN
jgi:hypothetical protein